MTAAVRQDVPPPLARYLLTREQTLPAPRSAVFAFFSDASNLERITPAFLRFEIVTPGPLRISEGTHIDYRLRLYGVPMRWRSRIEEWRPEESFVDTQVVGPYAVWHHTHTFADAPRGGTVVRDVVRYSLPFGLAGRLAHALIVQRSLDAIFTYRQEQLRAIFAG